MSQEKDLKGIQSSVMTFTNGDLSTNALSLFSTLGYNTDRQNPFSEKTYRFFKDSFFHGDPRFNEEKALVLEWKYVDLLFQLSGEEITKQTSLFDVKKVVTSGDSKVAMESYLFFAIGLSGSRYTRTTLSLITRELNRVFPMPVMVLFKYGQSLTLAVTNRRLHKRDERKDVMEKVTLIKDINIENPHRAHIEILFDLSFSELLRKHKFTNFVELHNAWQKTLDTKELNKRFYQELANWYFWAMDHVSFPDDMEKNEDIRNATSLIRLITRIIFIWFIKEKDLVPEALFDRRELGCILKEFAKNKESHSYYQAILQNLFFGTLNQKMDERGFAKEGSFQENRNNYGIKNLFRYAKHFTISEKEALTLFKDIPFLNGGLFDCLDKEDEQGKVLYTDGFSRNPKKQAFVPDFLFFGSEEEYDLNPIYGTKNKRYKVKGLIDILYGYKFTVTENTPIEEEVALDPELLGKVFENLLASYNPETQTTARKQTGSFYTPREIVNYMVDESLKAYLKGALVEESSIPEEDAQAGLDLLFEYTEKEHLFNEAETKTLIGAIDRCKILDPACGSGAFPMGVLHKMVHILHKLDPNNEQWKRRQIDKVDKLIEEARNIPDSAAREQVITGLEHNRHDIEDAFGSNELDYGRKLYLIENCIYGVDIQPIAVQIAKLRFFISLVVDQIKQPDKENLGIRSLPNLETKFVAANTLIGLEKPEKQMNLFENKEIIALEDKLKDLRHRYFSAKIRKEKMACQKEDKALRQKIATLLEKDGWEHKTAEQIVAFDPYDQNASNPFFDLEWMFGIKSGFDVVIGNPPYGADIDDLIKLFERLYPKTSRGFKDIYKYFFNCSLEYLVNKKGILSFITPNTFLLQPRYSDLRAFLLKYSIQTLLNLGEDVFQAVVPTVISLVSANSTGVSSNDVLFADISDSSKYPGSINEISFKMIKQKLFLESPNRIFTDNIRVKHDDEEVLENILDFKDAGINYQRVNVGLADKGNSDLSQRLLYEGQREKETHFEFWKGSDIDSYYIAPATDRFVRPNIPLRKNERVILNSDYFRITPKLIWRQTASIPIAVVDNRGIWFGRSIQIGYPMSIWPAF
ncbi:MAG: Eco57I restriction-modification methylase domain-containing protein [Desulfobacteria bacterium]